VQGDFVAAIDRDAHRVAHRTNADLTRAVELEHPTLHASPSSPTDGPIDPLPQDGAMDFARVARSEAACAHALNQRARRLEPNRSFSTI
jgi:hypothetical protein